MYILNFDELFNSGKLNKEDYIICSKEQAVDLLKYQYIPIGECEEGYVFANDKIIELLLKGGDSLCYII